jgi:hypothetical protein
LGVGVELAHPGHNVSRETDTHHLHDSLEDEEREVGEIGMRAMRRALLEGVQQAIAAAVRVRGHDHEIGRGRGTEVAETERLDGAVEHSEERHVDAPSPAEAAEVVTAVAAETVREADNA